MSSDHQLASLDTSGLRAVSGNCRNAVLSDIEDVARIHLEAFPHFFLSQLGYRFLCVMYRAFLLNPVGIFVVFESTDGLVQGFAVGALNTAKPDRWLALRYWPEFVVAVLPVVVRRPQWVLKRLAVRFFDSGLHYALPQDAAVLRSIGVFNAVRGGGAATALLEAFEQTARRQEARQVFLTTDQENNERAQRFYKRHGYRMVECFKQDGQRPMWLMAKNLHGLDR